VTRWGLVAEFDDRHILREAAASARRAGYRRLDAYSPMPLPDVAEALAIPPARSLALITLIAGLGGAAGGYLMQDWLMAVDYPLNVGGRGLHSWPAFVPITFEVMVLCAAITATAALLFMNGLPRPHHPLFGVPAFARVTQDGYFLSVEAADPKFDARATRGLLLALGARAVFDVAED